VYVYVVKVGHALEFASVNDNSKPKAHEFVQLVHAMA
jgi:hypothetical protein